MASLQAARLWRFGTSFIKPQSAHIADRISALRGSYLINDLHGEARFHRGTQSPHRNIATAQHRSGVAASAHAPRNLRKRFDDALRVALAPLHPRTLTPLRPCAPALLHARTFAPLHLRTRLRAHAPALARYGQKTIRSHAVFCSVGKRLPNVALHACASVIIVLVDIEFPITS
jgi:hypothetical protein